MTSVSSLSSASLPRQLRSNKRKQMATPEKEEVDAPRCYPSAAVVAAECSTPPPKSTAPGSLPKTQRAAVGAKREEEAAVLRKEVKLVSNAVGSNVCECFSLVRVFVCFIFTCIGHACFQKSPCARVFAQYQQNLFGSCVCA